MKVKFYVIECLNGWQAEANLGKWTLYSHVMKTKEDVADECEKLAEKLGFEATVDTSDPGVKR